MKVLDPIPDRHPRLVVWALAFRGAGYSLRRIADLFEIDPSTLVDAGVPA